ncbi:tyrosine-type recombinase/integrase [Tsukamurella sp. USMM236]|uniref:tyrosine-type recombinase/integrase n=1 Tax=Tsukamurella sp. USMM236 TaxID=3081301 RepID=UPI0030195ADA
MTGKRRAQGDGSLFKRADGYWVARVELPPAPDGTRRRRRVVRSSKAEAAAELRKLRTQVDRGEIVDSPRVTVKTWCEHWLAEIAANRLRPNALKTARSYIDNHITPTIGHKRLDRLTPDDIRDVTNTMTRPKADGGKGLATGTATNVHWLMSGILGDAVKAGRTHANVVDRVDPPAVKRTTRRPLDHTEAVKILTHLAAEADTARGTAAEWVAVRELARWSFGIFTGARQEDILGIEWDRIDLTDATADITWSLQWLPLREDAQRGNGRHQTGDAAYPDTAFDVAPHVVFRPIWRSACLVETKTRRSRLVPLIPPLAAVLQRLRDLTPPDRPTSLVFTTDAGTPVRRQDDTRQWNELTRALEIDNVQQHGARHTTATLLLAAGVPEDVRMAILGHSTAAAHRGYAHVDQTVTRAALEGAFSGMLDS